LPSFAHNPYPVYGLLVRGAWERRREPLDLISRLNKASGKLMGVELRTSRAGMAGIAPIEDEDPQG
jgi:hypothetical protein